MNGRRRKRYGDGRPSSRPGAALAVALLNALAIILAIGLMPSAGPVAAETREPAPVAPGVTLSTRLAVPTAPTVSTVPRVEAPVVTNLALRVHRLGAGEAFTCGLANDRSVRCWGRNYGTGSSPSVSETPWTVADIGDATSIAVGEFSGCAIRASGGVRCWGANSNSRLGYSAVSPPADIVGLALVRDLSVGSNGGCAVDRVGSVWCWGANSNGELGNGSISATPSPTPTLVVDLPDVARISSGPATNCAVTATGTVSCWGYSAQGQLGPGTSGSSRPVAITGVTDAVDVSVGDAQVCAVRTNGHVICWGGNTNGELGDGTRTSRPIPLDVVGIATATQVTAGSRSTCALLVDATVSCWGSNHYGELGIAQQGDRLLPTPVAATGLREVRVGHAEASGNHTCARRDDDRVLCWGSDVYGRLGTLTPQFVATPTAVEGMTDAARIHGDEATVCAQRISGAVACWGQYPGDGPGLAALPFTVPNLSNPTAIDAAKFHACASTAAASVVCWGSGFLGQFGNGSLAPAATPTATGFTSGVQKVVVLLGHTCALFTNGSVQCVGGFLPNVLGPTTTIAVSGVTDIDGYANVGCMITTARTVSCWQAGTSTVTPQADVSDAVELAVGFAHACARLSDGTVRCWGNDTSGQHGDGSRSTAYGSGTETSTVVGLTDAISIAAGPDHTCAVRANGHVVCWGSNGSRQLAFESPSTGFAFADVPVDVPNISDATGVATGGESYFGDWSCVRRSGGTVSCWGAAGSGTLGRTGVGFLDRPGMGPDLR